jgi:uncharacterized membrane protein
MNDTQEKLKALLKPGTTGGKVFYGLVFFVIGLMFVVLGFWKTLLVLALTALGVLIGSAETLGKAVAKVVDCVIPPKNQKVVYTSEDMEKVRNATRARKEKEALEDAEAKAEEPQIKEEKA